MVRFPNCPVSRGDSCSGLITYVDDRKGHDFRYAIDTEKCRNELGYEPVETFEAGMQKMVDWCFDNEKWWRQAIDG